MFKLQSKVILAVLVTLCSMLNAFGQEASEIEKHVQAAFISQFTKLIKWPEKTGDFIVYVIEDKKLQAVLSDSLEGKLVDDRPIRVQNSNWSDVVLKPGEIVIFPKEETKFHKPVIEKLKALPCLVVGFTDGLAEAGATINFFISEEKMKFELNLQSAKLKGLKLDPLIVKLGKVVN